MRLLSAALEQQPRDDLSERVMSRVALMDTVVEFVRLVGSAPFHWLADMAQGDEAQDDGADADEDDAHDEHEADDEHGDAPR